MVCLLYFIRNTGILWVMVSLTWSLMFLIIMYQWPNLTKPIYPLFQKQTAQRKWLTSAPISLCNVVYKLISKTLANRLKALLPHIISENQSAFTSDRLITDNVIVAFKLMHFLNHKFAGKEGFMVAKLDMSKAFDRVEWCFIKGVMERMGFSTRWINLIMECITSVSYSVLINGVAYGNIKTNLRDPTRWSPLP